MVGWDLASQTVLMNDPSGEADLVGGGYVTTAIGSGKGLRYSARNWGRRWMVEGPGRGWWLELAVGRRSLSHDPGSNQSNLDLYR